MTSSNRVASLFGIRYPIIQGGMVWCSGWRLASAVSNAGGLGLLGAGSMYPDVLREHVKRCKEATDKPFGVNLPLLYAEPDEVIRIVLEEKVPIVFTSAGSPATYTALLQSHGVKVAHVVANTRFALKAVSAGVDALVAEGFEAGGHNGIEETTTMTLIPLIRQFSKLPLIAAGGIATGSQMLAAMAMGAEGVQIGTRFAVSAESSAHPAFKQAVLDSAEGDTALLLKKLVPVRLLKNPFSQAVKEAEANGADPGVLKEMLGRGRPKKGIFEGDLEQGELEIGQAAVLLNHIETVQEIFDDLIKGLSEAKNQLDRQFNYPGLAENH
ncbi:MAG: nitronate monooxygenase [Bacteroidales bacterium]|nr:nitronate monooxygenase [Bacteroidales bacterium]